MQDLRKALPNFGFAALVVLATLLVAEAASAIFFHLKKDRFVFFNLDGLVATDDELAEGYRTVYDRDTGWIFRYPADTRHGERPDPARLPSAVASVFGNSFAWSGEVNDDETWPHDLALDLKRGVLNFGQTIYGTDQSLLLFRRKISEGIKTSLTIFAVSGRSIDGDVSVYPKFYYPPTHMAFTKPRFELDNGMLALIANPAASAADRARLKDRNFIQEIGRHDYWYLNSRKWYPELRFPYSRILLSEGLWRQSSFFRSQVKFDENNVHNHPDSSLWHDDELARLSLGIIGAFFSEAAQAGTVPVMVYLPMRDEVLRYLDKGIEPFAMKRIAAECEARHWRCLFPLTDAKLIFGDDPYKRFAVGDHYNPAGNKAMAAWLAERLAPLMERLSTAAASKR